MKKLVIIMLAAAFVGGCATETTNIDVQNDPAGAVMGLDYRDFDKAASSMVQSMAQSGALDKPGGGRYVMATSRIVNDTMQYIDTDQLMAKIEEELLNSGKVVFTSAVSGRKQGVKGEAGGSTDVLIGESRDLRESDEFNQGNIPDKGQLIAPELSVAGKIIQKNITVKKNLQQVEYYFQLYITDLTSGLRLWQREEFIGKRGSNKSVSW
jgi:penicillin-binding protein activator